MDDLNDQKRRVFLQKIMQGVGYGAFGVIAWSSYLSQSQAKNLILRPPGALSEKSFVSTCIRCGMCVEACPFDILELSTISDQISIGTPFFTPREKGCHMCPDIPCASACPTGALDLTSLTVDNKLAINSAKMGLATINTKTCLAYLGLQCTMCFQACPLTGDAIFLNKERNERTDMHAFLKPVVNPDYCTGCGMCEQACPTSITSIRVLPLSVTTGDIGSHFIVGWEKEDESRLDDISTDVTLDRTKRNEKSAIDNVNDVDGILKGIYDE
ncbi:MAG: ferredoxin-type protein NapG [Sulfurimonadaceae bacterium]